MAKFLLPIDTKSLHYNISNDNDLGHTATVATPIKQGKKWNEQLAQIFDVPTQIKISEKPELVAVITQNARTAIQVLKICVFTKVYVNNIPVNCPYGFGVYARQEVDAQKVQFGRIKLHYPFSFVYYDPTLNINNREVFEAVSRTLKGYAFLVHTLEVDTEENSINFHATIIGEPKILYSRVFINNKGVGNKFISGRGSVILDHEVEAEALKNYLQKRLSRKAYVDIIRTCQQTAHNVAKLEILRNPTIEEVIHISEKYPNAPYDFTYIEDGAVKYALVFFTASDNTKVFITATKMRFCRDFAPYVTVFLVRRTLQAPRIYRLDIDNPEHFHVIEEAPVAIRL